LQRASEVGRGDADDRRRRAVHEDLRADRGRVAAETILPEAIAQDGDRGRGARIVRRLDEPTGDRVSK
jgi:hypothetical protein